MAEVLLHHPRKHHRGAPPSLYTTDEPPPRIRHTDSTDDSHQRGNKRRDRGGAEEIGPGRKRNRPEHHHHHHHHHHNRRTTPEEGPRFLGHKRKLADIESSDANAASSPDLQELPYNRPIHFVDHRSLFDRLTLFSKSTYKNYTQQIYPTTKHESYADPEHSRAGLDGDERLNGIRMDLLGFADKPIELQMKMHEASLSIEGPMIYREEFFANKKLILERNDWKARLSVLFILTQRKMGKTYFLGQHAIVHAMNPGRDDLRIACISRTLDQAILTVAISRKLFNSHKRRNEFTLEVNQVRKIVIAKDGHSSEIRAYR